MGSDQQGAGLQRLAGDHGTMGSGRDKGRSEAGTNEGEESVGVLEGSSCYN